MEFQSGIFTIAFILVAMAALATIEKIVPLRSATHWSRAHLIPNIAVTLVTFLTNLMLNAPILLMLVWIDANGYGLLGLAQLPPIAEIVIGVIILDLAWYATHLSMHKSRLLWRYHLVHHSDPFVDVTTTARQHPGESLWRYVLLALFGAVGGVSPIAFAAYKVFQVGFGLLEHANIRLPIKFEMVLNLLVSSPSFHKVHHSREQRLTDTNYGNIFTIWDRVFGTFRDAAHGRTIDYGIDGEDAPERQSTRGLLARPFTHKP